MASANWDEYIDSTANTAALELPDQRGFENGYGYDQDGAEGEAKSFSLAKVQLALPGPLVALRCASNILLLAFHGSKGTRPARLVKINLEQPDQLETIDLPATSAELSHRVNTLFLDPTGTHAIVSLGSRENCYVFLEHTAKKRRPLLMSRFKGQAITAVGWCPTGKGAATREVLIGTATGRLFETSLQDPAIGDTSFALSVQGVVRATGPEKYAKMLHVLSSEQAVTGLAYEFSPHSPAAVVFVATESRLYQFANVLDSAKADDSPLFEAFFRPYVAGTAPRTMDMPEGNAQRPAELHLFGRPAKTLAWMTAPGVYYGALSFGTRVAPGDGVIDSANLIPYTTEKGAFETPLSIAVTEWHLVMLFPTRVKIISLLNDAVVYEEYIEGGQSKSIAIATDAENHTFWIYSPDSIFELVLKNEDSDVWSVYLKRANWELARKYAKTNQQKSAVYAAEADSHFKKGRFVQAAQAYAQSSERFEDVVLKLYNSGQRDALRLYLIAKLERLKKKEAIQRTMLATWLVEIYLSKLNELDDTLSTAVTGAEDTSASDVKIEKDIIDEDFKEFLSAYRQDLDKGVVIELFEQHGRLDFVLYYATLVKDHERIITIYTWQREYLKALETLGSQNALDLYYKFCSVLLKNAPVETTQLFKREPRLDVSRLLPALCHPSLRKDPTASRAVIDYLQYSILENNVTDSAVHNTLITLFATTLPVGETETDLLNFIMISPSHGDSGAPYYDLDYALRMCRKNKRLQACALIYSKMGLYEASVDLALQNDDLSLASLNADKPLDDALRKKLWLKIAKYVVGQKNDIRMAMKFLESTDLIKIEDILPFFPDFVVIDDFKEEICNALEAYSGHIETLKKEMDDATQSAEKIEGDIADLKYRYVAIEGSEVCCSCHAELLTRQLYVFPCQHAFHMDCLIKEVTRHIGPVGLRRLLRLQEALQRRKDRAAPSGNMNMMSVGLDQLRRLVLPDAFVDTIGTAIGTKNADDKTDAGSHEEESEKRRMREELDELIASKCVRCELSVLSVDKPFVVENDDDF